MTKFELHRDNFDYTIKHGAVIVGTFREILEIDAVTRAKAFISSWNATLEYCFESDYKGDGIC